MAIDLFSASITVCERVLQEGNGLLSGIRIVDLVTIPKIPAQIQAHSIVLIKANSPSKHHLFEITAENPNRSLAIVTPLGDPLYIDMSAASELATKPGAQIAVQLGINADQVGTYIFRVLIDKQEVAATAVTLRLPPSPQSSTNL